MEADQEWWRLLFWVKRGGEMDGEFEALFALYRETGPSRSPQPRPEAKHFSRAVGWERS